MREAGGMALFVGWKLHHRLEEVESALREVEAILHEHGIYPDA